VKASTAHLRSVVDEAVAELRGQMSLAQIAELLGVSVQRVSQIATGKHGAARPGPSLIYAYRIPGHGSGWHGQPDALPIGSYGAGTITFNPGTSPSPVAPGTPIEVRYGPVPDDGLPAYLQGYTTVNGRQVRPTAIVQNELFPGSATG